jgi:CRISPR-associated endonuclease/helicase Cas3
MSSDVEQTYQALGGFFPNQMQRRSWEEFSQQGRNPAFLLQASTGSGKTEAVLFPALHFRRWLILVLPARSLVDDLTVLDLNDTSKPVGRLHRYLEAHSRLDQREHALIVDTGTRMERTVYRYGHRTFPVTGQKGAKDRSHLYRGDVIVTTLDKFIYRFFGFAWGRKSYVYPLRIRRPDTVVCFDEAHVYDATAFTNFLHLTTTLYEKNVGVVVMSATLPEPYKKQFHFLRVRGLNGGLEWLDFRDDTKGQQSFAKKLVHVTDAVEETDSLERGETEHVSRRHLDLLATLVEQRWCERPRRIIVAVEAVRGAVEVYCRLKESGLPQLASQINLFLYHGRLDDRQRTHVYQQLKALDDHSGSTYVLVTTSAIEVGCDLNAETLITEICPPDSLVQRSGRCNRRGNFNYTAEVVVVGSHIPKFVCTLSEEQEQKFFALLQANNGNMLNSQVIEALLACLDRPLLVDPRAKTAFEMLYEFVYEFALENQPLYERGFIATRGWEPTLPLVIYDNNEVEAEISIEVSRLAGAIKEPPGGIVVEEWRLGEDTWEWHWATPPRPGSLYEREIRVRVNDPSVCGYTSELGFVNLPKVFAYRSRRGGYEVRLAWFLPDESQTESEGGIFIDKDTKSGKKKEIYFRYLSDPELIEVPEASESEGAEVSGQEEASESEESEE